jgi:hypothetical protein
MHYYLYFPHSPASPAAGLDVKGDRLASFGLQDLARDQAPAWFEVEGRGPDGGRGWYCTWLRGDGNDPPTALLPTVDWTPCRPGHVAGRELATGAYWIGLDAKKPPRPAELERKATYAGYWVTLGDGQPWHCPAATFLPHCHGLGADGSYQRQIDPEFADFWNQTQQFAQGIFEKLAQLNVLQALSAARAASGKGKQAPQTINADFDLAQTFAFSVAALAYNYRLNAELVTLLKLFRTDEHMTAVVKAATDLPVLLEVRDQKKTAGPERVAIPVG